MNGEVRPWGSMNTYLLNTQATVKVIVVAPGQALSLQSHQHRNELWVALDDHLIADVDGDAKTLITGETVYIAAGVKHRASSVEGTRFLEVSTGLYDDDDIVRFDDRYGRT